MLIHREGAAKVCLFSSYFTSNQMPYYVKFYLKELRRFFDQAVMLTNNDRDIDGADLAWLEEQGIDLMLVPNEGFDFGMWQKALQLLDLQRLERLALVNDSCILFAPLDNYFAWLERTEVDVAGMTESYEKTRHLQSYFLIFKGKAIRRVATYIMENPVSGMGYNNIVNTFELGMSASLLNEGFSAAPRYGFEPRCEGNPMYIYIAELIQAGLPMIKKRVVANESVGGGMKVMLGEGRNPFPGSYLRLIKGMYALSDDDVSALFAESRRGGRHNLLQFWRRYLRYRTMLFVGLLQSRNNAIRIVL